MGTFDTKLAQAPQVELGRRYFTLDQANRALVLVDRIVSDVLGDYQQVLDQQEILEVLRRKGLGDKVKATQKLIISLVERLQSYADELTDLGTEMKDWAAGMVDFPALMDGKEIQLCWRHGEESVLYWHSSDDGCTGRRPVSELPATLQ